MERVENLFFGEEFDEPFRLETRLDSSGRHHSKLFHNGVPVEGVVDRALVLLRYFAKRPNRDLFEEDIFKALWEGSSDPNIVEKYVSLLRRTALGDTDTTKERFIKTLHGHGYKFAAEVRREGDLDGIEAFPVWNRARFYELISKAKRGREEETEDLRIVTTGISSGLQELDIEGLLRKHVRIKILLMNPRNEALTHARYYPRTDKSKKQTLRELEEQINEIRKLANQYPPNDKNKNRGTLDFHLSDLMPCGFVMHTKYWAVLGIFLAHDSYVRGPMFVIDSESESWEKLDLDWKARWKDAEEKRANSKHHHA